jgi:hypothetical protein
MALPIIPIAGGLALAGLAKNLFFDDKGQGKARDDFYNSSLSATSSPSWRGADGNTYQYNPTTRLNEVVSNAQPADASVRAQLEAMGYKPGTPDYAAALEAGLASIEARRRAIMNSGGGPGVTPARRTSPELEYLKKATQERFLASAAATERGFGDVVSSIDTRRQGIDPEAAAAQARAYFANAAAATAANNAISDQGLSTAGGQDVVGIGPISGDAAAAPAYMTAAGTIAGDTSRRMAQLSAEDLAWLANTTSGAAAARTGELQQEASRIQAEAVQQFLRDEADRVARERAAQAAAASRRQQDLINLAGAEDALRADMLTKQAEAKADADRRWLDSTMGYEAERLATTPQKPAFNSAEVRAGFLGAARSGKAAFRDTFTQLQTVYGGEFDAWLRSQNIPTNLDADSVWELIDRYARTGK